MDCGRGQPQVAISHTIILCMIPAVLSLSNFYQPKNAAYNNGAYGKTCYNFTEYRPKCGWKTIIKSPMPLTGFEFSDQTVNKTDDYTFITTNGDWNSDFSTKTQPFCSDFHFTGSFGNSGPVLFITWYCICDASTSGVCKIVYIEDAKTTATSSTLQTQQSASTSSTTVTQSSTFASFTRISASSTLTTKQSSYSDVFKATAEWTSLFSESNVATTTGVNPSSSTSTITINLPSLINPTTTDINPTTTDINPTTTGINPTTTDINPTTTYINPTTTDINPTTTYINPTTTAINPTTTAINPTTTDINPTTTDINPTTTDINPTTTDISPTTTDINPTTTDINPTTTDINPTFTAATDQSPLTTPTATDVAYTNPATTKTLYTSMITTSTITTTTSNPTTSSSTGTAHENFATTKTVSTSITITTTSTVTTNVINPTGMSLTNDSKLPSADQFSRVQSEATIVPTHTTAMAQSTVSTISSRGLKTVSYITGTQSTTPSSPASTSVLDIIPSVFTSLTANYSSGSIVPAAINPTASTTFSMTTHASSTKISTTIHKIVSVTSGITNYESPVDLSSAKSNSLHSTQEMDATITTTISTMPTFHPTSLSTRPQHKSATPPLYASSEFISSASVATRESQTYTTALLLNSPIIFATVYTATESIPQASISIATIDSSPLTTTKLWLITTTVPDVTTTTTTFFKHMSTTTSGFENPTVASTRLPTIPVPSPSLTHATSRFTSESTPATMSTATVAASLASTDNQAPTTNHPLSVLATSAAPARVDKPWSIYLHRIPNYCYTGQNYKTLTSVTHVIDCAARCIRDASCKGINFRKATRQCDLVDDEKMSSTWEMTWSVGCAFWEMVWKQ